MTIIKINNEEPINGCSADSVKYCKDCNNFVSLNDATKIKEYRYCNLSLQCRQVDVLPNGKVLPMEAHRLPVFDTLGNKISEELFCTGMHDLRPLKERIEDDKVS